jgi:hypothetical protein
MVLSVPVPLLGLIVPRRGSNKNHLVGRFEGYILVLRGARSGRRGLLRKAFLVVDSIKHVHAGFLHLVG